MRVGVTDYIMLYYWREFNLAIFYDSPNRQIKVLAKLSRYTVQRAGKTSDLLLFLEMYMYIVTSLIILFHCMP